MPQSDEKYGSEVPQDSDKDKCVKSEPHDLKTPPAEKKTGAGDDKRASDNSAKVDYGYDLYPERQGGKYKPSVWEHFFLHEGENLSDQITCEKNVYNCFKKSHGVKLMLAALKASGCPVDMSRNVSCETCEHIVTGGYDPSTNQIVVCQNVARKENVVQGILVHELIHMFDFCTKKVNFANLEHLACTEIRAANLTHCSYISSIMQGDSSPINIKRTHQECVKNKAACSLVAARGISKREAVRIVDLVFPQCYGDLEPIGRRVRRNSDDIRRAYLERHKYGYV
ncbi:mitochondrial inner membrane protease ATP23 homolog [Amphibalanus amphitrite]|nr:mitochondrial inner membrane protease ATP23 homolog isoform X2 [Amphibalanus amphitrite]XP_043237435.1 mitochondrial inner membrane protease ATP23 homolog isoform X2 [Amphibalanus amphitrite]XP_043237436.1 mitochondrial inner membrane protease ATP23 homolog isoform X2 [Amphibalanus amphitrite]XP_043237437.1 mitochondrial inner membrane protease ATP23 homolog isoform X2 [Amphibalanus amphitrite]XP_043237439.1 mitochondrial inner membrane protease ATP23 homolog isoform X2 [Amphibalanus amphitr